jgi:hypothetical protein
MNPVPNDTAKHLLLGFNEKVARLERTRFYKRYKDELPGVVMQFDRLDSVTSTPGDSPASMHLQVQGYVRIALEQFDQDEIDAFMLTYRMLTQDNDRYSVRNLAKLYEQPWVDEEVRRRLAEARDEIRVLMESDSKVDFGQGWLQTREIVDVVTYGELAHSNSEKEQLFKEWTSNPSQAAMIWVEYMGTLRILMRYFLYIRDLNSVVLCNVFNIPLPEHLLAPMSNEAAPD